MSIAALARLGVVAICLAPLACKSSASHEATKEPVPEPAAAASASPIAPAAAAVRPAAVGEAAPDFTLPDLDGKLVHLADYRGKTVVLEWFNPECPFVRASHTKGSLVDAAARATKDGVVWLAINSGGAGRQGHGPEKNREGKDRFKLSHPILLDDTGQVGHLYGAAHTPHMYVIDPAGKLVYRGAIDNSPDGEGESPTGGTLIRYVEQALLALTAGKPIAVSDTKAYGCSVKYAK